MSVKKFLFPSLALCTVLALAPRLFAKPAKAAPEKVEAARAETKKTAFGSSAYATIDAYVAEQKRRLNIPGVSLAIVEGDQIVHVRGFGRTRPGGEAPAPQTPFFIGSTTKSFTALAVMQLVEAGKVELDAPVQHYLPWFRVADPQASAQISVRHLLNQTSGLPLLPGWITLADFDERPDAAGRQARALAAIELPRPAGAAYEYTNVNFDLLGLIVEAVSGETYADYVRTHIFDPLEMRHSYTTKPAAKQDGLAVGHRFWFWSPVAEPDLQVPSGSIASGQLISSAEDMAHYLIAQLNGGHYGEAQVLSSAGIEEMHRGVPEVNSMGIDVGKYGMGWFVSEIGPTQAVWHSGSVPDFTAFMAILPEQKKGVVLLVNTGHFMMEPIINEFGMEVAALLADQPPEPLPVSFMALAPWAMRALLLIPLLQIAGVSATIRRLGRWRRDPAQLPIRRQMWGQHIVLPLIPNLLVALTLVPVLGKAGGFLRLFMPDFSWVALICGSFALVWSFLRTGLMLRILRKPRTSATFVGRLSTE